MYKIFAITVCVFVATIYAEVSSTNSAPYRASGWKPDGPSFSLPKDPSVESSYGPPPVRSAPNNEYGPPIVGNYVRPREILENPDTEIIKLEKFQEQKQQLKPIYREHYHHYYHHNIPERYVITSKTIYPAEHLDIVDDSPIHLHLPATHSPYILRYQLRL